VSGKEEGTVVQSLLEERTENPSGATLAETTAFERQRWETKLPFQRIENQCIATSTFFLVEKLLGHSHLCVLIVGNHFGVSPCVVGCKFKP